MGLLGCYKEVDGNSRTFGTNANQNLKRDHVNAWMDDKCREGGDDVTQGNPISCPKGLCGGGWTDIAWKNNALASTKCARIEEWNRDARSGFASVYDWKL